MQQSFHDLGVPANVARTLAERGFQAPFPIQAQVLPHALAGRDVLAKSPTGSGKTLAFAIPIAAGLEACGRPTALVLVPTRELASGRGRPQGHSASCDRRRDRVRRRAAARKAKSARRADVLVATPGRLNDLLERDAVALGGVRILVLDEADRMLDMGFKPQVDRIVARVPRRRQTMFFSATLDNEVGNSPTPTQPSRPAAMRRPRRLATRRRSSIASSRSSPRARSRPSPSFSAASAVRRSSSSGRRGADRLVRRLAALGVPAVGMHGDMNQKQRERTEAVRVQRRVHARRDRRRRARPRPGRDHARDQLRPRPSTRPTSTGSDEPAAPAEPASESRSSSPSSRRTSAGSPASPATASSSPPSG